MLTRSSEHVKSKDGVFELFSGGRFNVLQFLPNSACPLSNHEPQRATVSANKGVRDHDP